MKSFPSQLSRKIAFTLIELLVVIAIIVALAGLLFPIMNRVTIQQAKALAKSELNQLDTAIKAYHAKYGFYPPNPTNAIPNPLFYELVGSLVTYPGGVGTPPVYVTLDGSSSISSNLLYTTFQLSGLANSSASTKGTDEQQPAIGFLKEVKPDQLSGSSNSVRLLLCSAGRESPTSTANSPWRYNSTNPTNNSGSYDLWVDLYIGGKTNRFNNWSSEPLINVR